MKLIASDAGVGNSGGCFIFNCFMMFNNLPFVVW